VEEEDEPCSISERKKISSEMRRDGEYSRGRISITAFRKKMMEPTRGTLLLGLQEEVRGGSIAYPSEAVWGRGVKRGDEGKFSKHPVSRSYQGGGGSEKTLGYRFSHTLVGKAQSP